MPKPLRFTKFTWQMLNERLAIVRSGSTPTWTDIRHFFYECRNKFLRENPELSEIDSKENPKDFYRSWSGTTIANWCKKHCAEFGIDPELYWRLREKLNIWAEGRAVCEGEVEKFLVDNKTRNRMSQNCSFVLICEKKTVNRELLEILQGEGYKLNIVGTGGQNPTDVLEAVLGVVDELDADEPTFYFLVLHDYDVSGLEIYFNLKKRYAGVIDIGINREFFRNLKCDPRLVEEQVKIQSERKELKAYITNSDTYTNEDFEYLQGIKKGDKNWLGKRIEIDAVHVQYGIKPFADFVMQKIEEECKLWDLSRIGVGEYYLSEPYNPFNITMTHFNQDVTEVVKDAWAEISEPLKAVDDFVAEVTSELTEEYDDLIEKYHIEHNTFLESAYGSGSRFYEVKSQEIKDLKEKYDTGFKRKYAPDYDDELKEINTQRKHYKGDVRKGSSDLWSRRNKLQEKIDQEAKDDEEAKKLKDELDEIDWGKDDFELLDVPDEKDVIKYVIERLQERLKELEGEGE